MIKIDARSAPTGRLEMAALSSGVRPPKGSNFVMIFNLGSNSRGEAATPSTVSPHNALWELLQWPLLFEQGIGGYFSSYGVTAHRRSKYPGARRSGRPGRPQAPTSAGAAFNPGVPVYSPARCHNINSPPSFSAAAASPRAHQRAVMHPSRAARPTRRDAH